MLLRIAVILMMGLGLAGLGAAGWIATRPPPAAPVVPTPVSAPAPAPVVEAPPPPPAEASVLAAAQPLRAGTLLKPEDLVAQKIPPSDVPQGARPDTLAARSELVGAMVRRGMMPGEIIKPADVMRPGDHGFLAAVLSPGMRAVTLGVDAVSGTAGLIWPGDRVDLILTQQLDDTNLPQGRRTFAETVLTDVRVIAIDQQLVQGATPGGPEGQPARTVTLEVVPAEAERVAVATRLGRLSLAVRSAERADGGGVARPMVTTWGADVSPALGQGRGPSAPAGMRVYQGTSEGKEFRF